MQKLTVLLAMLLPLAGCVAVGGATKNVFEVPERLVAKTYPGRPAEESRIIVVRWPAIVDESAYRKLPYVQMAYTRKHMSKYASGPDSDREQVRQMIGTIDDYSTIPELLPLSSTYEAMELYWAVRRNSPMSTVLLEPTVLVSNADGEIHQLSLTNTTFPVDLISDISVSSSKSLPLINNGYVFSLRASPRLSEGNCGLLIGTEENFPLDKSISSEQCKSLSPWQAPFSAWWHSNAAFSDKWPFPLSTVLPLDHKYTVVFPPLVDLNCCGAFGAFPKKYIAESHPNSPDEAEAAVVHPFVENYAKIIAASGDLQIDIRSHSEAYSSYAEAFDGDLARALRNGISLSATQAQNLSLLKRLYNAELKVRAKQDEKIARAVFTGEFGTAFRRARDDMYAGYQRRVREAWVGVLAAGALHSSLTQATTTSSQLIGAQNRTIDAYQKDLQAAGNRFYAAVAPGLDSLSDSIVEVDKQFGSLRVKDQADLRKSLISLYTKHRIREGQSGANSKQDRK